MSHNKKAYFLEIIENEKNGQETEYYGVYKYKECFIILKLKSSNHYPNVVGHYSELSYRCTLHYNGKDTIKVGFIPYLINEYVEEPKQVYYPTQKEAFDAAVKERIKAQELLIDVSGLLYQSTKVSDPDNSDKMEKENLSYKHYLKMLTSEHIKECSDFFTQSPMPVAAYYRDESGKVKMDQLFHTLYFPDLDKE